MIKSERGEFQMSFVETREVVLKILNKTSIRTRLLCKIAWDIQSVMYKYIKKVMYVCMLLEL